MSDLITSLRPDTFEDLVGAEKLIRQIRKRVSSGKIPKAWMFVGPTGVGKTTTARIVALSLQCTHQKEFGHPCRKCRKHSHEFDITELNGASLTGKKEVEEAVEGVNFAPKPGSRRRIYIIDEAHKLSDSAQSLLLKPTEDCPRTTNWIICTTKADSVLPTLQSRCTIYPIKGLDLEAIKKLVKRTLQYCKCDRDVNDLAERLYEKNITGGRLIIQAVQKYLDPETTADEASEVTLVSEIDTYTLCRCVVKGEWESVTKILQKAKNDDNIAIRASVAGYLNTILLDETDFGNQANSIAEAILKLSNIYGSLPATSAILYKLCKYFSNHRR